MKLGAPFDLSWPVSTPLQSGLRVAAVAVLINLLLATGKIVGGVLGQSYALIADGIESTVDILSSLVVWAGLRLSVKPPDAGHPFGHGKAESLAAVAVSLALIVASVIIAVQSVREILTPHLAPKPFTLAILLAVIGIKEVLFRFSYAAARRLKSAALKSDAWHHRSDAITSVAAFIGITVALIGGKGYEGADDWAALLVCGVIGWNGWRLLRSALDEVMERSGRPGDCG